jgi:hypothetical protein
VEDEGSVEGLEGAEDVNVNRYLEEGRKYIEQGDPVQASEKLYKAAEEAVKTLAKRFSLPECEEAESKGRWTATLLFSAVRSLSEKVSPQIVNWWHAAWFLHVEGFHEARLSIEEVKFRVKFIEELVKFAEG